MTFLVAKDLHYHYFIAIANPLQQFNVSISRLSKEIQSLQQEFVDFKSNLENWDYHTKEIDIQEWYTQSQVNQMNTDEIVTLKDRIDQLEK